MPPPDAGAARQPTIAPTRKIPLTESAACPSPSTPPRSRSPHGPGGPSVVCGGWAPDRGHRQPGDGLRSWPDHGCRAFSGEARAINLAGLLRMQSYLIDVVVSSRDHRANLQAMEQAFTEFEARYCDPELQRAIPARPTTPLRTAYATTSAPGGSRRFKTAASRAISPAAKQHPLRADTAEMVVPHRPPGGVRRAGLEASCSGCAWSRASSLSCCWSGRGGVFQLKGAFVAPCAGSLDSAHRVRCGDFQRASRRGTPTNWQLGEAFNFMVEDLSRSYARLGNRVREKTEELARSNRSLNLLYSTTRRLSERAGHPRHALNTLQDVEQAIGIRSGARAWAAATTWRFSGSRSRPPVERLCQSGCLAATAAGCAPRRPGPSGPAAVAVPGFRRQPQPRRDVAPAGQRRRPSPLAGRTARDHWATTSALAGRQPAQRGTPSGLLDERSVIARELHDCLPQALSHPRSRSRAPEAARPAAARNGERGGRRTARRPQARPTASKSASCSPPSACASTARPQHRHRRHRSEAAAAAWRSSPTTASTAPNWPRAARSTCCRSSAKPSNIERHACAGPRWVRPPTTVRPTSGDI